MATLRVLRGVSHGDCDCSTADLRAEADNTGGAARRLAVSRGARRRRRRPAERPGPCAYSSPRRLPEKMEAAQATFPCRPQRIERFPSQRPGERKWSPSAASIDAMRGGISIATGLLAADGTYREPGRTPAAAACEVRRPDHGRVVEICLSRDGRGNARGLVITTPQNVK